MQLQKIKMLSENNVRIHFFDHSTHETLLCDLKITANHCELSCDLPVANPTSNQLFLLLKKHLQNAFLEKVSRSVDTYHLCFSGHKYLMLNVPDAQLELNIENKSVLRVLGLKFFTKIKVSDYIPLEVPEVLLLKDLLQSNLTLSESTSPSDILPLSQRNLRDQLKRKLKTLKKALSKQVKLVPTNKEVDEVKNKIKTHSENLEQFSGQELNKSYIQLKKMQSAQNQNQTAKINKNISQLESDLKVASTAVFDLGNIPTLQKKWNLREVRLKNSMQTSEKLPWRTIEMSSGEIFLIGRSSAENDALVKSSKSNDLWFHAIQVPGSHIILKRKTKEFPSAKTTRAGLILAIHFSKLSQTKTGEVYQTTREFLKKRRNDPPGFWHVLKAESFHVKYQAEELEEILKN